MVRVVPHVATTVRRVAHGVDRGGHSGADGAPEVTGMSIPTKILALICGVLLVFCAGIGYGSHATDKKWKAKDVERKLADAKASRDLSEQHRIKERKLNETIGEIETRAINDAANMEMEYKAVMDRLRNASAHPAGGLRIKPTLTCRAVPNSTSTTSNGNAEVQTGLSPEIAERIIGTGAECDQVVLSLQACQAYAESLRKEKPIN